jgi:hypothetical protein
MLQILGIAAIAFAAMEILFMVARLRERRSAAAAARRAKIASVGVGRGQPSVLPVTSVVQLRPRSGG